MKKILILILFFPLFSCNDWLNVESEVSVTYRNYFQSEQDIEDIFITLLGYERDQFANSFLSNFDLSSLKCTDINKGSIGIYTFDQQEITINPQGWAPLYQAIYLANMLEDNRYRFLNVSEERADYWIAQANFIKGLMYFEIARKWGEAPIAPRTEDASAKAKSPVDTILAYAIRAAEAALILPTHDKLTDAQGHTINSRQYASIGSVHTLLANIYAWMGGLYDDDKYWKKAEEEASLVIDGKAGFYNLVSIKDLVEKTFGRARDVTEVIFALEINTQDEDNYWINFLPQRYPGFNLINYPYSVNNNPWDIETGIFSGSRISVEDVKALYTDEKDLRRKEYWHKLGENPFPKDADKNRYDTDRIPLFAYINKWREPIYSVNPAITENGPALIGIEGNKVYWRLADLILLRAECRAHLGMPEAVDDLDRIRQRAGLERYTGIKEKKVLLREIFDERDRELFGETCRYYDIVRNGYVRDELHGNYLTLKEEDIKNGALYLPISKQASVKNPFMKQNIYWSTWTTK